MDMTILFIVLFKASSNEHLSIAFIKDPGEKH